MKNLSPPPVLLATSSCVPVRSCPVGVSPVGLADAGRLLRPHRLHATDHLRSLQSAAVYDGFGTPSGMAPHCTVPCRRAPFHCAVCWAHAHDCILQEPFGRRPQNTVWEDGGVSGCPTSGQSKPNETASGQKRRHWKVGSDPPRHPTTLSSTLSRGLLSESFLSSGDYPLLLSSLSVLAPKPTDINTPPFPAHPMRRIQFLSTNPHGRAPEAMMGLASPPPVPRVRPLHDAVPYGILACPLYYSTPSRCLSLSCIASEKLLTQGLVTVPLAFLETLTSV